ncbi:2Fe-2S iron-sulfur cluster-binding protein [Streptomyces bobili]|uniref:2Fe-2S iron-sulfur cluster-binding protein n=1 Tax=Streptomyces bobili TaxID=67280 RepID=UPI00380711DF
MPKVVYTTAEGTRYEVDGLDGDSLMETAVRNGVPGIVAECGGAAACATCHVYVDDTFVSRLTNMDDLEDDMLEGTASERLPTSRLACQLRLHADLEGIAVSIPPEQT